MALQIDRWCSGVRVVVVAVVVGAVGELSSILQRFEAFETAAGMTDSGWARLKIELELAAVAALADIVAGLATD